MSFINSKRIRDYPRLIFFSIWVILAFNIIFRNGWLGALNQIIGSDFITLYAAGSAYRTNIANLYDLSSQYALQQEIIEPTQLPGVNPFISPPYVAQAYSIFTYIPLPIAFILWTLISIALVFVAIYISHKILPDTIKVKLPFWQLLIIGLSFFPFIEGLQAGQNHALTLLLITALLIFTLSERWYLAGIMAGLLIYKPQLVIGFIVIWIVWRKYKALVAFMITAMIWVGAFWVINGFEPYQMYLNLSRDLFLLPYVPGFPGYLLTTLYGFLTTLLPIGTLPAIRIISLVLAIILMFLLVWMAYKYRNQPIIDTIPILVLALLVPILVTPYTLLHDLVILLPAFILWARYSRSTTLLYVAIMVYLGSFFLTLVSALTKVALIPIITLGITILVIVNLYKSHRTSITRETDDLVDAI